MKRSHGKIYTSCKQKRTKCFMRTFSGGKAAGAWNYHSPPSRSELYLHFPVNIHGIVITFTLCRSNFIRTGTVVSTSRMFSSGRRANKGNPLQSLQARETRMLWSALQPSHLNTCLVPRHPIHSSVDVRSRAAGALSLGNPTIWCIVLMEPENRVRNPYGTWESSALSLGNPRIGCIVLIDPRNGCVALMEPENKMHCPYNTPE
jgi:hypothetical protein